MGNRSSPAHDRAYVPELPGPSAKLTIKVGPTQPWGIAEGTVPPDQAHHLITTFGIVASAFTGTGAAVLTLQIAPRATMLAFDELIVGLATGILVAACSLARTRRRRRRRRKPERRGNAPGGRSA
jgi:hypothetical protein